MHPVARLLGLSAHAPGGIRYLSVCSGIEAATTAWHALGWQPAAFSEIEPFPSAVLAHHWPHVPNLGDMTRWREWPEELLASCDLIVGGTPCQAFSVAGLRKSLDDERGNLTLTYVHIIDHIDRLRAERGLPPVIAVWENVPGVLSTKDNAFGCFLGTLAGEDEALVPPGKRWANAGLVVGPQRQIGYRVLDAQYFGVAQRRRRVFLVASARDGFCPAEILFVEQGVRRDSPPSREAGQDTTGTTGDGVAGGGWPAGCAPTLNAHFGEKQGLEDQHVNGGCGLFVPTPYRVHGAGCETLVSTFAATDYKEGAYEEVDHARSLTTSADQTRSAPVVAFSCKDHGADASHVAPTLRSMGHDGSHANAGGQVAVCIKGAAIGRKPEAGPQFGETLEDVCYTQNCVEQHGVMTPTMQVRRLTVTECARLQGFPDHHTLIPWRGKPAEDCPDGPQYKAYGNSMAVPCMGWVGRRIAKHLQG